MPAVDMFLRLDGIKGESKDATVKADAAPGGTIHIESFSWGETQTGGQATSSHFDGRLLTADDLSDEQAARAEFEAFGGFSGGIFVGASDAAVALPGGLPIAVGDIDGDALSKHEQYLTYQLSDALISG